MLLKISSLFDKVEIKRCMMDQNLETLKIEAKSLNRFKFAKIALVFMAIFVICFFGIIIFAISGLEDILLILFATAFVSFIIAFVLLVIHGITHSKKEVAFKKLLFQYLWRPIVLKNTFYYKNDYELLLEKENKNTYVIMHPVIPNRATEQYGYTIKNMTAQLSLYSLYYYTRSSNGNGGSSTITYFNGFAVETNIPVEGLLYIRSDRWYSKITAQFGEFSNYRDEGDVLVNGTYTEQMKKIRTHFLSKGFKDVSFINQDNRLMILLNSQKAIPRMRKYDDATYKAHEAFVMRLVDVLEYVSDLS
mgnify:CR=1 FL=1